MSIFGLMTQKETDARIEEAVKAAMLKNIPRWMYQDWSGVNFDAKQLKEKMVDKHVDEFDALKYAEVARPTPAYAKPTAPPMSFDWLRRMALREQRTDRTRRS